MRLSIFVGLLYVAWCINSATFESMKNSDHILIWFVLTLGLIADFKDLFKKESK